MRQLRTTRIAGRLAALAAGVITGLSLVVTTGAAAATGGNTLWVATYHGALPGWSAATAEGISGSTLFVTGYAGYTEQEGSRQWVTIAYNADTGASLWRQAYRGADTAKYALNGAVSLDVSPDGSTVFVSGYSSGAGGALLNTVIAYNAATGATKWVSNASAAPYGPASLTLSPDGSTIYLTMGDYQMLAYATATGDLLWTSSASGLDSISEAHATAISPDGSTLFVTGMGVNGTAPSQYQTVAYDAATGSMLWIQRYARPGAQANSIALSPDGSAVYVAGYANSKAGNAVIAYNSATGAALWTRLSSNVSASVVASPDGSAVFVAGIVRKGGAEVYDIQARNPATGALAWTRTHGSARLGQVSAMTLSPDGSALFVTGADQNLSDTYGYNTVAYTAAGGYLWTARYYGPHPTTGEVAPAAIVASPDGSSVYVTGIAPNAKSENSFATVAYTA
jgi:hypothetical protein